MSLDPVVPETTVRDAIDRVTAGVVETQRAAGVPIPGGRQVEDWVKPIVERQVKLHEDGANRNPAARSVEHESPSRITRGDVGPNTRVIERDLSASPRGRRHMQVAPVPVADMLLLGRLQVLRYWPCELGCTADAEDAGHRHAWRERLLACGDEARAIAQRNGFIDDFAQTLAVREKLMLDVVELSGAPVTMGGLGLGDYKAPRTRLLVRLDPVAGQRGLVPIEQIQREVPRLIVG
jgi:hypothetical protein